MPADFIDSSNPNSLWCSVVAETLVRCGVREVVISPGSRSTPLTFAFVRHAGLSCTPVLDERSAAFFALGLAKRSSRPVALVCTSGTAGANYLPAVIEARESSIPLLVLTADRPPELRACGSGQTIDQLKLYGDHVLFHHEMAVPEASLAMLSYARQIVAQAVLRTQSPLAGPVHLNCPFRDPLPPESLGDQAVLALTLSGESFWTHLSPHPGAAVESALSSASVAMHPAPRFLPGPGVIIAGPLPEGAEPATHTSAVASLARVLGWPVLADTLSQLRQFPCDCPALVTHYDALLRSPVLAARLAPAQALILGPLPTSKVLRTWLAGLPSLRIHQLNTHEESRDPLHASTTQLRGTAHELARALESSPPPEHPEPGADAVALLSAKAAYVVEWSRANAAARLHIDNLLGPERALVEPKAAWLLGQMLPRGTPLFVANSMPVRDLEYVWGHYGRRLRVHFSRGANGIDGTLSTAFGIAQDSEPAVLYTGDLSFLHDSNGLLLHRRLRGSLTIVLIDNAGGGIFGHLPVARFNPPFEEYFATPQQVDFAALASAHGLAFHEAASWEDFAEHIRQLPPLGTRIVLLRTNRTTDAALRKALFADAAKAAAQAVSP